MSEPGFWDDQERAQRMSTEHARVSRRLETYERLDARVRGRARASTSSSPAMARRDRGLDRARCARELERLEEAALFNGEYDAGDAVVTLQSGTGGTDAQDWTEMMLRMYERWGAEPRLRQSSCSRRARARRPGSRARPSRSLGENAYGILKAERGKHRLVRLSPVRLGPPPPDVVRDRDRRAAPARRRRRSRSTRAT